MTIEDIKPNTIEEVFCKPLDYSEASESLNQN